MHKKKPQKTKNEACFSPEFWKSKSMVLPTALSPLVKAS